MFLYDKCKFIEPSELKAAIDDGLKKGTKKIIPQVSEKKLKNVWIIGESPRGAVQGVAESITVIPADSPKKWLKR